MTRNEALFEYRQNKGLTLEEAAAILGIKKKKLKNYEEGYHYLKDEVAKDFASKYGLEPSAFLLDDKGYITSIDYEDKTKLGLLEKAMTIIAKVWVRWTSLALALISMAVFLVGAINYGSFYISKGTFFEEPYKSIYYDVKENGETMPITGFAAIYSGGEGIGIEAADNFYVIIPHQERYAGGLYLMTQMSGVTGITDGYYYLETWPVGTSVLSYTDDQYEQNWSYVALLGNDGSISNVSFPDRMMEGLSKVYEDLQDKSNAYLKTYGYEGTIIDLFAYLGPTNENLVIAQWVYLVLLFFGGILMALFFLLLTFHFAFAGKTPESIIEQKIAKYQKKKAAREEAEASRLVLARDIPSSPHYYPFVLREDWLRCIFLLLFFIGNLAGIFTRLATRNPEVFGEGTFLYGFGQTLPYMANLASFTLFFLKIEGIIRHRDTLLSFFSSLSLALLFYVGEVAFYLYLGSIGLIGEMIASMYLPGNMFSGLAAITLFAFFMLRDPQSFTKRWQTVVFRCFAIIPFGYLLLGFSVKAFMGNDTPLFISGLLNSRIIEICMFAVAYVIFLFISKTLAERQYGKEKAKVYLSGNRFLLYKNLFLVLMVIIICVLSYFIAADDSLFTIEYDKFLYLLIPVFLFYRPRYPVSPMKNEFLFEVFYVVALGAPYVLAALLSR